MFRIIVKNLKGDRIDGAEFESQEALEKWKSEYESQGTWGKPDDYIVELEDDTAKEEKKKIDAEARLVILKQIDSVQSFDDVKRILRAFGEQLGLLEPTEKSGEIRSK